MVTASFDLRMNFGQPQEPERATVAAELFLKIFLYNFRLYFRFIANISDHIKGDGTNPVSRVALRCATLGRAGLTLIAGVY